jgi:hypothetical protein
MALGRTAKFYKKSPKAQKVRAKYRKKYNARPDQKKKRAELNKLNRKHGKKGDGLDVSHTKNGIKLKKPSVNRGSKTDTKGDRKARGGK